MNILRVVKQVQIKENTYVLLELLRDHLPGPLVMIWDRSNIHDKSRVVQEYLGKHPEVHIERLPASMRRS